jgi:hypothetical protein
VYSSVNIAVVVRDLAGHPYGRALADDLLHVLGLDDVALMHLDRSRPRPWAGRTRDRLERSLGGEQRALVALATSRAAAREAGLAAWSTARPTLEAAPMGGWSELSRWVRDELLDVAWLRTVGLVVARWPRALEAVLDGLRATYAGADPGGLAQPWRRWTLCHPPAGSATPEVAAVIAAVGAAKPAGLAMAGAEMRARRSAGWSWPVAMHEAAWAVEVTSRGRTSVVAQLSALAATLDVMGRSPAPDVVSAVTAAVHATVVADALPAETISAMCAPLLMHA